MMERRTRRMSSSLLPLNITPAITSIHPPAWWNGPLGPLTSDRDLYAVDSRGLVCPTIPGDEGHAAARLARHDLADRLGLADRFALRGRIDPWVRRPARDLLDRARPARPLAAP